MQFMRRLEELFVAWTQFMLSGKWMQVWSVKGLARTSFKNRRTFEESYYSMYTKIPSHLYIASKPNSYKKIVQVSVF